MAIQQHFFPHHYSRFFFLSLLSTLIALTKGKDSLPYSGLGTKCWFSGGMRSACAFKTLRSFSTTIFQRRGGQVRGDFMFSSSTQSWVSFVFVGDKEEKKRGRNDGIIVVRLYSYDTAGSPSHQPLRKGEKIPFVLDTVKNQRAHCSTGRVWK